MDQSLPICALIVGHEPSKPGALGAGGMHEYEYNTQLAGEIFRAVRPEVCRVVVMFREGGYRALPRRVNETEADFAIELHFNAFDTHASGTEVLHWHKSRKGEALARLLQSKLVAALGLPDRGLKPIDVDGRGGYLLGHTRMPCVIAEPFFGDNMKDWVQARTNAQQLIHAYARAIEVFAAWTRNPEMTTFQG